MMHTTRTFSLPMRDRRNAAGAFAVRLVFTGVIILLAVSAVLSAAARAAPTADPDGWQPLPAIRAAAEAYLRDTALAQLGQTSSRVIATAGELDSRLRFARCQGPLNAFVLNKAAPLAARNTVGVRCEQGAEWTVYLPVMLDAEIRVLVLRRAMPRGAPILEADVDAQLRRVPGLISQYVSDVGSLYQYRIKRPATAGAALTQDMLQRDAVIRRGQQVILVSRLSGIDVRANGVALSDGGDADRIRVQNQSSLKVVEGVVESSNLVRVGM